MAAIDEYRQLAAEATRAQNRAERLRAELLAADKEASAVGLRQYEAGRALLEMVNPEAEG